MNNLKYTLDKILLQALEAEDQGLMKLAEVVIDTLKNGPFPKADADIKYSYAELKNDMRRDLWKMSARIITYHNIDSVNISKLDNEIISLAEKYIEDLEMALGKNSGDIGPLEPKVSGQK